MFYKIFYKLFNIINNIVQDDISRFYGYKQITYYMVLHPCIRIFYKPKR